MTICILLWSLIWSFTMLSQKQVTGQEIGDGTSLSGIHSNTLENYLCEVCPKIGLHFTMERVRKQPIHRSGLHKWRISPDGVVINGTRVLTADLFRRMNGFAPLFMSADCEFTTRCLRSGVRVVISEEIVALRRMHGNSLSYGKSHGMGSQARDRCHQQLLSSYEQMRPGFDPRPFGGLVDEQKLVHFTRKVERNRRSRKCGCGKSRQKSPGRV